MNFIGTLVNSSSGILLSQELTSINGEAKAKGKTVEEQLWMETFPGRQSGTDWTRRQLSHSSAGHSCPQPAEMDTWWRVNGEENTLWSRVEILFWDEPRGAAFTQFGQKILQLFRRKVMNMIKCDQVRSSTIKYDPFKTFPALPATDFCHAVSKYERSKMFLLCY